MLNKIREAFSNFEKSTDHVKRIRYFSEAIELIKKYNDVTPDHQKIIKNLKLTYTRKLIEQLSPETKLDFPENEWPAYLSILIFDCKKEVEQLTSEYPELKKKHLTFIESLKEDIKSLIEYLKK